MESGFQFLAISSLPSKRCPLQLQMWRTHPFVDTMLWHCLRLVLAGWRVSMLVHYHPFGPQGHNYDRGCWVLRVQPGMACTCSRNPGGMSDFWQHSYLKSRQLPISHTRMGTQYWYTCGAIKKPLQYDTQEDSAIFLAARSNSVLPLLAQLVPVPEFEIMNVTWAHVAI